MSRERRQYSKDFKLAALARFAVAENVADLAQELGIRRELLYKWDKQVAREGPEALRPAGRPRPVEMRSAEGSAERPVNDLSRARQRIAELERKVGQQQLDIDFFRAALRHFKDRGPKSGGSGGPSSTR